MGDLADILRQKQERAANQHQAANWFYPEGGGWLSKVLGTLDLTLGAPARGIQGGLIALGRGEDPFSAGVTSAAGFSLDTGEWGQGEMASGVELLEEIGILGEENKDTWYGITAGIGTDVVTDLAAFNFAGAAKNLITKPGKLKQFSLIAHPGARYKTLAPDLVKETEHGSRIAKESVVRSLDVGDRKAFMRGLDEIGVTVKKRLWKDMDAFEDRALRAYREPQGSKIRRRIEKKNRRFRKDLNQILDSFEFDDLVVEVDKFALQQSLIRPTTEHLGRTIGNTVDGVKIGAMPQLNLKLKVKAWSIDKIRHGTDRPPSWYEMRFPDAPRFLRDAVPENEIGRIGVNLATRHTPKGLERIGAAFRKVIPAQLSPFDYTAVLRNVGTMPRLMAAHNEKLKYVTSKFEEMATAIKELGVKTDRATGERIGRYLDGRFAEQQAERFTDEVSEMGMIPLSDSTAVAKARPGKSPKPPAPGDYPDATSVIEGMSANEIKLADKLSGLMDEAADLQFIDPTTGVARSVIPDWQRRTKYFPHMQEGFQQRLARDFVVLSDMPGWGGGVNLAGDVPKGIFVPHELERAAEGGRYNMNAYEVVKSYIVTAARKAYLEPAIKEIIPSVQRLNQPGSYGVFRAAQSSIQAFAGNYSVFDGYADDLLKSVGLNTKNAATKLSVAITAHVYSAMLGVNPRTSLLQVSQGILNNSIHLGIWQTLKGFTKATRDKVTGGWNYRIRDSEMLNETMSLLEREYATELGAKAGKIKSGYEAFQNATMAPLNAFDNFNRGWSFHAGFGAAKKAGLSDEMAMLHGIKTSNETQFIYGKLGASPGRNNPMGRVLLQFMSFAAKQASFLTQSARRDPGTAFLRYLAISGMVSRTIGKQVDVSSELAPIGPGDVRNLLTMQRVPALQAAQALVDFGTAMTEEALGVPLAKRHIDPAFAKEQFLRTALVSMVPGGTMIGRAAKYAPTLGLAPPETRIGGVVTGAKDAEVDKYGRTIRPIDTFDAVAGVAGFRTPEARAMYDRKREMDFQTGMLKRRYERLMQEAIRARMRGADPTPFLIEAQKTTLTTRTALIQGFRQRLKNRQVDMLEKAKKRRTKKQKRESPQG